MEGGLGVPWWPILRKWARGEPAPLAQVLWPRVSGKPSSPLEPTHVCLCRRVVVLMEMEVLRPGHAVPAKIGNPVPYTEGKPPFLAGPWQLPFVWSLVFELA